MAKVINRYALFDAIRNITYNSKDADAFFEEVLEVIAEQPTTTESEIRAKAIDEFAEKLIATFCYEPPVKQKIQLDNVYDGESIREIITEVAEQLKEE